MIDPPETRYFFGNKLANQLILFLFSSGCIAFLVLVILNQIPSSVSRAVSTNLFFVIFTLGPPTDWLTFSLSSQLSRPKRELGANLYLPGSHVIPGGEGDSSGWGEWSAPSECSRTCGGGVSQQTRQCLNVDAWGRSLCRGGDTKYFSCNTQVI